MIVILKIAVIEKSLKIPIFLKIDTRANYFTVFLVNHIISGV